MYCMTWQEEDEKVGMLEDLEGKHAAERENTENIKAFLDEALKEGNAANFLLVSTE